MPRLSPKKRVGREDCPSIPTESAPEEATAAVTIRVVEARTENEGDIPIVPVAEMLPVVALALDKCFSSCSCVCGRDGHGCEGLGGDHASRGVSNGSECFQVPSQSLIKNKAAQCKSRC